jgi:hypothetical protein
VLAQQNNSQRVIIILLIFYSVFDGVLRYFQQYFSYIIAVSFIGEENHRSDVSH